MALADICDEKMDRLEFCDDGCRDWTSVARCFV